MSIVRDVQGVLDEARALVASIPTDDLSTPTPCEGWDVQALAEHMTGVVQGFAGAFGAERASGGSDDIREAYGQAVDAVTRGIQAPDALDRTLDLPFGTMPAENGLGILLADQMIHTWDLARALGRPYTMNEQLAGGVLQAMRQLLQPAHRGAGMPFAAEVPCSPDAPVQDRLLAFSGRQP